jgi:hypothetical protein
LHNAANGADLVDVLCLGLVDRGIVLGGQKDLAIAAEGLFQGTHAGFAAHDKRRHHIRKNHHVPDGHHGQLALLGLFAGSGHSAPRELDAQKQPWLGGRFLSACSDCTAERKKKRAAGAAGRTKPEWPVASRFNV